MWWAGVCSSMPSALLVGLTFYAAAGGFLFGYDTGVVSGAMELIRREWGLDDVQHEAIVSSTTGLAAVGALAALTSARTRCIIVVAACRPACHAALRPARH